MESKGRVPEYPPSVPIVSHVTIAEAGDQQLNVPV